MIEEIVKRRSIRHFLQKPIPQEDLDEILTAGLWAPSEKNAQPWKFIVIRGQERKAMVKRLKEGIMRNRKGDETAALRTAIDAAIDELCADGTLKALSEKYFGRDISTEE